MSELVRVSRGLWRPAEEVSTVAGRSAAVLQVLAEGSVIAGVSAALLHGLWLPPMPAQARVEVDLRRDAALPRAHARSIRSEVLARRRMISAAEIVHVQGVPTLSVAATWVQLAETLADADLVAAGDSALRSGASMAQLQDAVLASGRRRGVVRARRCLPLLDGRSRSRMESLLRVGLVIRGLPKPEVNVAIHDVTGGWLGEPDLSYDDVRLALEYNGADHAEVVRMRRDISREFDLLSRGGWQVLTVGPAQVLRQMDQVAAAVRDLRWQRRGRASSGDLKR